MTDPRHVVIIGAARSGTKLVRDALAGATGVGAVPYDVGYVWRYGNENHPDDAIAPEQVTARSHRFIRDFVDRYALGDPPVVIEKTVGNAMRVPLVARTFPDAVFVHLLRDGVDVVESTRRQWFTKPDPRYLLHKARHFPVRLLPRYGSKYARSVLRRRTVGDRRLGSWGPRYPDIDDDLESRDLLTVCARQWSQSVCRARSELRRLSMPVVNVRYEELVLDPLEELTRIAEACGLEATLDHTRKAERSISPARTGAGRHALTRTELTTLDDEIGDLLAEISYRRPLSRVSEEEQ